MKPDRPIYLDYNATTPLAEEVIDAMRPYLESHFGNPSSAHPYGQIARQAVDKARAQVAALINATPEEVIFTSGGTEANNLALLGLARRQPTRKQIIISAIEHPAITEVCDALANEGFTILRLPVDATGKVSPADLEAALTDNTLVVSIMHANNEVGTIQPIRELADLAHAAGALFHTDAAQSVGKIPVDVQTLAVDLLSIAGHKLYAPKGIGALYLRQGVEVAQIMFGAGQERGLRPGTENVLEITGLGEAAHIARRDLPKNQAHFKMMRDLLHNQLLAALSSDQVRLNGHPEKRLPNTLNLSFKGQEANTLLDDLQNAVAASAGAACHAGQVKVSPVLQAMGTPLVWAQGAVRFSVGRSTTADQINQAAEAIVAAVHKRVS